MAAIGGGVANLHRRALGVSELLPWRRHAGYNRARFRARSPSSDRRCAIGTACSACCVGWPSRGPPNQPLLSLVVRQHQKEPYGALLSENVAGWEAPC
jgi:hypothetical protein